jgi:hypothetical protein
MLQLAFQDSYSIAPGVFLMKSVNQEDVCRFWNVSHDTPMADHIAVAKLLGTELPSTSPLGNIVSISRKKNRIAIADWDVVKIWSINPAAFCDKKVGSRTAKGDDRHKSHLKFPFKPLKSEEAEGKDDLAYTTRSGHGYHHSYVRMGEERRIVALHPVELPPLGVVYTMEFMNEDTLWAWTDRGLVKWYWGIGRNGLREERGLIYGGVDFCQEPGSVE